MARSLEEYLGDYFRQADPEGSDPFISFRINEYKDEMGKNITSRFCSQLSDDEEICALILTCCFREGTKHWYHSILGDIRDNFEWVLCLTNQKIIVFSKGFWGFKLGNRAVRSYPLKNIHSVATNRNGVIIQVGSQKIQVSKPVITLIAVDLGNFATDLDNFAATLNKLLDSRSQKIISTAPQPIPYNTLEQLERLTQLYQQGVLAEQEFQEQKQRILQNN